MRVYTRPFGWPIRKRVLYDTALATLVHRDEPARWVADPGSTYAMLSPPPPAVTTLYRSPRGRFFTVRETRRGAELRPLWRWVARAWLLNRGADPDMLASLFPEARIFIPG